jgi:hypothetical protein
MDHSQVKTRGDFRTYVLLLATGIAKTTPLSLEEYLWALWSLLPRYQTDVVTFALLGQLLHDAFFTEPLPFDEHWLQYDRPPDVDDEENERSFAKLQQMIGYQIADLHRMAQEKLLDNKLRYFGITSPTGYTWSNFEPSSYLHCAIQSLQKDNTDTDGSWIDLTILLWLGQIYE